MKISVTGPSFDDMQREIRALQDLVANRDDVGYLLNDTFLSQYTSFTCWEDMSEACEAEARQARGEEPISEEFVQSYTEFETVQEFMDMADMRNHVKTFQG